MIILHEGTWDSFRTSTFLAANSYHNHLTLGRTRKFIPPPWYKGGGMDPPPPPGRLRVKIVWVSKGAFVLPPLRQPVKIAATFYVSMSYTVGEAQCKTRDLP